MFCGKCGNQMREGQAFCARCGWKVPDGSPGQFQAGPATGLAVEDDVADGAQAPVAGLAVDDDVPGGVAGLAVEDEPPAAAAPSATVPVADASGVDVLVTDPAAGQGTVRLAGPGAAFAQAPARPPQTAPAYGAGATFYSAPPAQDDGARARKVVVIVASIVIVVAAAIAVAVFALGLVPGAAPTAAGEEPTECTLITRIYPQDANGNKLDDYRVDILDKQTGEVVSSLQVEGEDGFTLQDFQTPQGGLAENTYGMSIHDNRTGTDTEYSDVKVVPGGSEQASGGSPGGEQSVTVKPKPEPAATGGSSGGQAGGASQSGAISIAGAQDVQPISRPSFFDAAQAGLVASEPAVPDYTVEPGLKNVVNAADLHLSDAEVKMLEENGFSVRVGTAGDEFFKQYELNRYLKKPNFVTVDSMMHTYHLYFSHLLKTTERDSLSPQLASLSRAMLDASAQQLDQLKGTEWEDAALRNVGFFAVGASLMGDDAKAPSEVADAVAAELALVRAANGIATSPLTGDEEDYSQYAPRGYYEGDEALERYFRAMMWYGRMNFAQKEEDLDRSALLMTLALADGPLDDWEEVYAVTSFFAGASDDCGYYEYYPVAQAAYGADVSVASLPGDALAWGRYHALTAQMRPPKINSVVVYEGEDDDVLSEEAGFRFMGQRFSLDESIFQKLVYSEVGKNDKGEARMLPDALDVPAALGSDEALSILEEQGDTSYPGYSKNMQELRDGISEDDADLWNASLYSQWLYTLNPLLKTKGAGYPLFMQSQEWARKNLQSYLGSYTELKHDTVLYSKQVMAELGGGNIDDKDDRGYVEPEPEVFSRLARLTQATSAGLQGYGMLNAEDAENLGLLQELAEQLATIANKELSGELPTDAEFELIRSYGGQLEHFWQEACKHETTEASFTTRDFPASVVTDVATDPNGSVLELGTGNVSIIFVVVPVDGTLRVAEGTVYSFYQFEQPLSQRLTDTEWRKMIQGMPVEEWTRGFQFGSGT